jgi:flavin reductase (DIM6/NTAB) family NADH-FMN oxidoreductase RutF
MPALTSLEVDDTLWERVFTVAPLVLVGTREPDGSADLAPKHRILQLSGGHFGFVCRPAHATYRNALATRAFTVSWPHPGQIVKTSAASAPRCDAGDKPALRGIRTTPATVVDGVVLEGARLMLECEYDRTIADFGGEELIIGRIVAAHADPSALRSTDRPDSALIEQSPHLAFLYPSQFATISHAVGFPFPKGFQK